MSLWNQVGWGIALVAASLGSGCTAEIKTGSTPAQFVALPTSTPIVIPTMAPNEFVSKQDPNLTVRDIKQGSARIGKVVEGVIINRGTRTYSAVSIQINCVDGQGKIVGSGRDAIQEVWPGDQRNFRVIVSSDSDNVQYKVGELRGY
ncbi:hypothetical protein IAD21_04184 [Abditibacteriota bacterium]|nr:hypothetical protein IAD21_04184 [Abditibacteriota bacterium]